MTQVQGHPASCPSGDFSHQNASSSQPPCPPPPCPPPCQPPPSCPEREAACPPSAHLCIEDPAENQAHSEEERYKTISAAACRLSIYSYNHNGPPPPHLYHSDQGGCVCPSMVQHLWSWTWRLRAPSCCTFQYDHDNMTMMKLLMIMVVMIMLIVPHRWCTAYEHRECDQRHHQVENWHFFWQKRQRIFVDASANNITPRDKNIQNIIHRDKLRVVLVLLGDDLQAAVRQK